MNYSNELAKKFGEIFAVTIDYENREYEDIDELKEVFEEKCSELEGMMETIRNDIFFKAEEESQKDEELVKVN